MENELNGRLRQILNMPLDRGREKSKLGTGEEGRKKGKRSKENNVRGRKRKEQT